MDSLIVFVAKYFIVLSLLIFAWFWFRSPRSTKFELALRLIVGGALALAISVISSHLYYDPRPFVVDHVRPLFAHPADNGFPSDHALFTSLLGFTVLAYSKRAGGLLLAVAIGAARMAAHVHSLQDIVGSFVISALAAIVAARLIRRRHLLARLWRH